MTADHSFEVFTTSRGARIYRLLLEAFPGFTAHVHLVFADDYCMLIDCGSGYESSNAGLASGFERVSQNIGRKIGPEDLTHILITHGHIDHFGGLVFLRERTKALVGVHELDWQTITRHEERLAVMSRRLEEFIAEAGVPVEERGPMITMSKFTKAIYRSVPVDFTYEAAGMKVGAFEMVHLPGHCPGHVAIRLHDVVFCGDHALMGITPHQAPERLAQYMGVGHYLASLSLFEGWAEKARLVFSGHGEVITDLPACAARIRQQLALRLQKALDILAEPHTIAEVAAHLYSDVNGYYALLAVEKTGALIEYLYQRGLLGITNLGELESSIQPAVIKYRRLNKAASSDILPKERANVFV